MEVDDVDLYERVLETLREKELQLPCFMKRSPHFVNGDRRIIVEWIIFVCSELRLALLAEHLAVALFDFFIDCHQADNQGLYLVAAACVSIACKLEDIEVNIPSASKLLQQTPLKQPCALRRLRSAEILVLQHFDWLVHLPTEAHFIDYYASACLAGELEMHTDEDYKAKVKRYFHKWINYFREKTLQSEPTALVFFKASRCAACSFYFSIAVTNLRFHRPSVVACSVVLSTRRSLVMKPDWPSYMVEITSTKQQEMNQAVRMLMNSLEEDMQVEKQQKSPALQPTGMAFTPSPIHSAGSSQPTTPAGEQWPVAASSSKVVTTTTPTLPVTYFPYGQPHGCFPTAALSGHAWTPEANSSASTVARVPRAPRSLGCGDYMLP